MKDKILEIIARIIKKDMAFVCNNLDTENIWDSLLLIELVIAMETEFAICLEPEEIGAFKSPNSVIDLVLSKAKKNDAT